MTRHIFVKRVQGQPEPGTLDIDSGRFTPIDPSAAPRTHGTLALIEGQTFAIYVDQGTLWLQWNERRWPMADVALTYGHDLDAQTTTFSAADRSITYPAWWRGDPTYEPLVPEEDEVHDWLAYAAAVKSDAKLQAGMLKSWG
jgi:hypothetical protein